MRYCGHFLIKAEGGAKNYERDHPLPLAWRPFTVVFLQRKGYPFRYQSVVILHPGTSMSVSKRSDACPNDITDILSAVVTSEIAQILSLYGGGF